MGCLPGETPKTQDLGRIDMKIGMRVPEPDPLKHLLSEQKVEYRKDDSGKPRADLFFVGFAKALPDVIEVCTRGAKKYGSHNWMHINRTPGKNSVTRTYAAMLRHVQAVGTGEWLNTADWGLPHLAHAVWCGLALLCYYAMNKAANPNYNILDDLLQDEPPEDAPVANLPVGENQSS